MDNSTRLWLATLCAMLLPMIACGDESLEAITVTAQRRVEKLQDVPIAITAVTSADIQERGIRQAGDITASVPNMLLNSLYGPEAQPTFALRGVTTQDFSQNQSSPIAMYVDEVYKSVGALQALQIYDLDRVEVLRGPQGTLYGKNATGGAVSFYSKNPSLSETEGYATLGVGNYSAYNLNAAVGAPIVDNEFGWRAAILYEKRDGWVRSIVPGVEPLNGVDALAMRLTLMAKPVDGLTATLKFSVSRSGGTPYGAHALNNIPSITGFSGNIDWFSNGAKFAVHKDIRDDSVSLKLDWELNEHFTLTSVTGYDFGRWYERSDDGGLGFADSGTPIRIDDPNTYFSTVNALSQEIRLTSRDLGAFSWLAGLYYGRDSTHATLSYHFFDQTQGYGGFVLPDKTSLFGFDEYNNFDQIRDSKAIFLNAGFSVTPQVTLRAGVRYTKDKLTIKNFYALEGGLATDPALAGTGSFDGPVSWTQTIPFFPAIYFSNFSTSYAPQGGVTPDLNQSNDNLSFKAGVDWKPSDDLLVYASFSQGYRGAAFNGQALNAPGELTFASPERLNSFEAGLKSEFWNHKAEFNVAVFHYDYRNQQFLDSFANPAGGTLFHTRNAKQSRVDGAEFELRARMSADFEMHGSIGLMDSKYIDLTLHGADRSGNKLIQAPPFDASLSADWRFAHLSAGDLKLNVNGNYYGKQYFDAQNTERIAQDSYAIANARVSYESAAKQGFSAGIWIKNITNRQYLADAIAQGPPSDGGLGFDYSLVGEPRTYGVDLTYRF